MPFRNILDPEHRAILMRVLDDICVAAGIEPQSPDGQEVANLIVHLYGCGYQTADGLKAVLDAQMAEDTKRYG
jgi:hypothetical protein